MNFKNIINWGLFILVFGIFVIACSKDEDNSNNQLKECEINKTGTFNIYLSGNLGLDPVDVYLDNEWVDSLMVYDLANNKEDVVSITKPAGLYSIELRELSRNGGAQVIQWDTTINVCDKLELSYFKKR